MKYNAIKLGEELRTAISALEDAIEILEPIVETKHIDLLRAEIHYLEDLEVGIDENG